MIETITLRNFKGHAETVIECARFTVLVGENASGKTSVLRAVRQVGQEPPPWTREHVRRGASEAVIRVVGVTSGQRWRAGVTVRLKEPLGVLDGFSRLEDDASAKPTFPPKVVNLSFDPAKLAAPSNPTSVPPTLSENGEGLSSVLMYLKLSATDRFNRIETRMREVVPFVRNLVLDLTSSDSGAGQKIENALYFDFVDARRVPASLASEGTLLTLGVLTALESAQRTDIILIDDIDRALHPRAQRDFITAMRGILATAPDLQIIATSHSPYLLDSFTPDEAVVLGRNHDGVIIARRLSDFPDEHLRSMLSTGELWISEGDRWVAQ